MGTSNWQNIPYAFESIIRIEPNRVLEIGVGYSRWGTMARKFCWILLAALALAACPVASASEEQNSGVIGVIDGFKVVNGALVLHGWACDVGQGTSIQVHLYAGGSAGPEGTGVKAAIANLGNEHEVDEQCKTTGVPHRFEIPITGDDVQRFANQPLYVHGISVSGGVHLLLFQSGTYTMPAHIAFGRFAGLAVSNSGLFATGWACDQGIAEPVTVELYAGDPAGAGTLLRTAVTEKGSEPQLSDRCGTTDVNHRFRIPIQPSDVRAHGGKPLYMRARSASGGPTLALGQSGEVLLPKHMIMGLIDGVRPYQGHHAIFGWACDYGFTTPIAVHAYAGGPTGEGTLIAKGTADQPADPAVARACGTPDGTSGGTPTPHRFIIPIEEDDVRTAGGKPLYLHGIRKEVSDSPANLLLARSGEEAVPAFFTVGWSSIEDGLLEGASQWEIPAHLDVVLDKSPIKMPLVHVKGQLRCGNRDLALSAKGLLIEGPQGLFECGTKDSQYQHKMKLTLLGDPVNGPGFASAHNCDGSMDHPSGPQSIVAKCGGRIRLHGVPPAPAWTRLSATANAGDTEIVVHGPVNWEKNDQIAIASTGFDGTQADEAIIESIDDPNSAKPRLKLKEALKYRHLGAVHEYRNNRSGLEYRSWTLDQSAEVALLTRNIVIEGTECDLADGTDDDKKACIDGIDEIGDLNKKRNKRGGHIMVTAQEDPGKPLLEIDAVELSKMGRMSELGRYPIHWHRVGQTHGDYVKRSSIHHSFQRCVVVHGTHGVNVENNVCFDHYGHGYMLEDGDEHDNTFKDNLGFVSRRPPIKFDEKGNLVWNRGLLYSDNREVKSDRWSSPATYWITNPANFFERNVAAGSQGTGFWFALVDRLACESQSAKWCRVLGLGDQKSSNETVLYPKYTPLGSFENNVVHSSRVGISTDGAPHGGVVTPCDENGQPTTTHESNKCGDRGLEMAHYSPREGGVKDGERVPPSYVGLSVWRNLGSGFYFRGDAATVDESVFAESVVSAFFDYNQTLKNSLVVGIGPELNENDPEAVKAAKGRRFFAARLYDGPFTLDNVHLAGYRDQEYTIGEKTYKVYATAFGNVAGANKAPTNRVLGLTFETEEGGSSLSLIDFGVDLDNETGVPWQSGLLDVDGSLSGSAGSTLIPYAREGITHPEDINPKDDSAFITAYNGECPRIPSDNGIEKWKARRCPPEMSFGSISWSVQGGGSFKLLEIHRFKHNAAAVAGSFFADTGNTNKMTVPSYRTDAAQTYEFFAGEDYGFGLTLGELQSNCATVCVLRFDFKYVRAGDRSPIVRVQLPSNTNLVSVASMVGENEVALVPLTTEQELENEQALEAGAGYYANGSTVSLRFEARAQPSYVLADAPFNAQAIVYLKLLRNN
jgi:hypothetical protein